jgi:hypothetical protein
MDWTQDDGGSLHLAHSASAVAAAWSAVGKWQVEIHHADALVTFLNMTML